MKLYHISRTDDGGYDTYSDAVVAAETEDAARMIHPSEYIQLPWDGKADEGYSSWIDAKDVQVEYLGEAKEGTISGVICSSFHAG